MLSLNPTNHSDLVFDFSFPHIKVDTVFSVVILLSYFPSYYVSLLSKNQVLYFLLLPKVHRAILGS